jgi:hypothetical protein
MHAAVRIAKPRSARQSISPMAARRQPEAHGRQQQPGDHGDVDPAARRAGDEGEGDRPPP